MMTAPIVQIFWSHRISFLVVMCLTFIALASVIFTLPTRATVRSSIDIGSAAVDDTQAFERPENVARQIHSIYGPAALLAMANKGVSPQILEALQDPSVESIGRSVVMVSTIDPSLEEEAKEFHEITADLVTKELTPRVRILREDIANRLALASKVANDIEKQIKDDGSEIDRIGALTEDLRNQLEKQRANLAALYQRVATPQAGDNAMLEVEIREQREQISSMTNLIGNLVLERSNVTRDLATTRRLRVTVSEAVANAQFEKDRFNETRISVPPARMPATESKKRRRSLLVVAFVVSMLAGFGTLVVLHNMGTRRV